MGGSSTISTSETKIEALKIQSSAYGVTIPVVYGMARISGNMLWYGGFVATAHTDSQEHGKGGGVKTQNTTYTYSASVMLGLCEGPIVGIPRIWKGKELHADRIVSVNSSISFKGYGVDDDDERPVIKTSKTGLADLNLSLDLGTQGQATWPYLTTKYPSQAIGYSSIALVRSQDYQLGTGAQIDNHTFEIKGLLAYSCGIPDSPDANPALIFADILANPRYGVGFPTDRIADCTDWSNYCQASGTGLSPALVEQVQAGSFIEELARITNSAPVWTSTGLKIIPYADTPVSGLGSVTYTPNVTPIYDLTDDDFTPTSEGDDPIQVIRKPQSDAYNHIRVEFTNRGDYDSNNFVFLGGYNVEIAEAKDSANIALYGLRSADVIRAHWICDAQVARNFAQLCLQRSLYIRNTFQFSLPWTKALLEPMDLVTLTDKGLGYNKLPVRITEIAESETGDLDVAAEEFPVGVAHSAIYKSQDIGGFQHNYSVDPGDVEPPVIFEAPADRSVTGLEVYAAVRGLSTNWGGCRVWTSLDGISYKDSGILYGGSRYGTLTGPIDGGTLPVKLVGGQLGSGSSTDAKSLATLVYIDGTSREYLAYTAATLTGELTYKLSGLVRAAFNTKASPHSLGAAFARVDDALAKSGPLDLSLRGQTIRFKFTSINVFGSAEQALPDVKEYAYRIDDLAVASGGVTTQPSGTTESPGDATATIPIRFDVDANGLAILTVLIPPDPSIKRYELRQDDATVFGECTLVGVSSPTNTFELPLSKLSNNSFRVRALYTAGGYSLSETKLKFTYGALPAIERIDWRIEEPNMVLAWPPVQGAGQYAVYIEEAGVTRFRKVTDPRISLSIPKYALNVRVLAIDSAGAMSAPFDKAIGITGAYHLNEIVNIAISTTAGNFAGLGAVGAAGVERPDLLGPSALTFPISTVNNASLFSFGYNLASTPVTTLQNVVASWFRDGFWRVQNGYYESPAVDMGAVLTGVLKATLTKTVEFHGGAVNNYSIVSADYLGEYTAQAADDQSALLTAKLYITSDNPAAANWTEVQDGQTITGRYVRMVIQALSVGPLTRVRVTAGTITLDVPDITKSGTAALAAGATVFVGLTGFNSVQTVIATPDKSSKVWITGLTAAGFTINSDTVSYPTNFSYFVKGY